MIFNGMMWLHVINQQLLGNTFPSFNGEIMMGLMGCDYMLSMISRWNNGENVPIESTILEIREPSIFLGTKFKSEPQTWSLCPWEIVSLLDMDMAIVVFFAKKFGGVVQITLW